jgi:lipoic acid synthetase
VTIAPEGRRLLRVEARNAETPIERKPEWIKTRAVMGPEYTAMKKRVHGRGLHTVCEEAGCPNIFECWEDREASFLIGGDRCTRRCDFCDIATGKPDPLDPMEPLKVAESVKEMGLRYSTITGVARDDLPDGAAGLFAETCKQVHAMNPGCGVELLIDDIKGSDTALQQVFDARPEVFAHNLETVPRIFKQIRPAFRYERSLSVLSMAKSAGMITKSNLILGMGETPDEVIDSLERLHDAGCDIITITQYLRPSKLHHPIDRWLKPQEFVELSEIAEDMGFLGVMAGPMVRSSYRSGRLWAQAMKKLGREIPENLRHLDQDTPARQEAASVVARMSAAQAG